MIKWIITKTDKNTPTIAVFGSLHSDKLPMLCIREQRMLHKVLRTLRGLNKSIIVTPGEPAETLLLGLASERGGSNVFASESRA